MLKSNFLFVVCCFVFLQTHPCLSQKQTDKNKLKHKSRMKYTIKGIANGFIRSGTYGGSINKEVVPSEYNYTFYDVKVEKDKAKVQEFQAAMEKYLEQSIVNNDVSLKEYLQLLYNKDTDALKAIHNKFEDKIAKGSSYQPLPTLIFIDDKENTVLRISPYQVKLSYKKIDYTLMNFLEKNARKFNSTIPDSFYNTYYKKD